MSDIICVTNRRLCHGEFLSRIEEIAACRPAAILLREKDLSEETYERLAGQVIKLCQKYDVPCILHSFLRAAKNLQADKIHLPLPLLRATTKKERAAFRMLGASCHSIEEAKEAKRLGCTYITAGHIFATDCKKTIPPRGVDFLKSVCDSVSIPVYAIGGICGENIEAVRCAGAAGACVMSGPMQCKNGKEYFLTTFHDKNGAY